MSKQKVGEQALVALKTLLEGIQDRVFWLTGKVRDAEAAQSATRDRLRVETGERKDRDELLAKNFGALAAAHNRLRFDFDHQRAGQNSPIAQLNESLTRTASVASLAAATGVELRRTIEIQQAEIDRLRELAAQRADLAVKKYNELETKVVEVMQRWNERISKLEGNVSIQTLGTLENRLYRVETNDKNTRQVLEAYGKRLYAIEGFRRTFSELFKCLLVPDVMTIEKDPEPQGAAPAVRDNAANRAPFLSGMTTRAVQLCDGKTPGPVSHS